jgi:hypothetical protein
MACIVIRRTVTIETRVDYPIAYKSGTSLDEAVEQEKSADITDKLDRVIYALETRTPESIDFSEVITVEE